MYSNLSDHISYVINKQNSCHVSRTHTLNLKYIDQKAKNKALYCNHQRQRPKYHQVQKERRKTHRNSNFLASPSNYVSGRDDLELLPSVLHKKSKIGLISKLLLTFIVAQSGRSLVAVERMRGHSRF